MDVLAISRRYINATYLQPYAPLRATISDVKVETVGGGSEPGQPRLVVYFSAPESVKGLGLILNRTNQKLLAELLGRESTGWVGKEIGLEIAQSMFRGSAVPGIRVAR